MQTPADGFAEEPPRLPPAHEPGDLCQLLADTITTYLRAHPEVNAKQIFHEIATVFADAIASACPDKRTLEQALTFVHPAIDQRARFSFKQGVRKP